MLLDVLVSLNMFFHGQEWGHWGLMLFETITLVHVLLFLKEIILRRLTILINWFLFVLEIVDTVESLTPEAFTTSSKV